MATTSSTRVKVLEFLKKKGESEIKVIAKNVRIPEMVIKATVEELKRDGFVVESEGKLKLTELGFEELKRMYDLKGV